MTDQTMFHIFVFLKTMTLGPAIMCACLGYLPVSALFLLFYIAILLTEKL